MCTFNSDLVNMLAAQITTFVDTRPQLAVQEYDPVLPLVAALIQEAGKCPPNQNLPEWIAYNAFASTTISTPATGGSMADYYNRLAARASQYADAVRSSTTPCPTCAPVVTVNIPPGVTPEDLYGLRVFPKP